EGEEGHGPPRRRDEQGPACRGGEGEVLRGPLLPVERGVDPPAAAARPGRGHRPAGAALPAEKGPDDRRRRPRHPHGPHLARERARALQHARTGGPLQLQRPYRRDRNPLRLRRARAEGRDARGGRGRAHQEGAGERAVEHLAGGGDPRDLPAQPAPEDQSAQLEEVRTGYQGPSTRGPKEGGRGIVVTGDSRGAGDGAPSLLRSPGTWSWVPTSCGCTSTTGSRVRRTSSACLRRPAAPCPSWA